MSTKLIFPYQFKLLTFGRLPDPVIYLDVVTQFGIRKLGFLVDSGSDTTVLPLKPFQFWFNFNPKSNTKTILGGVEGKGVGAYPGMIKLKLKNTYYELRCYFIESKTIPLLGRLDLWDKFSWLFDNTNHQVVFTKLK